MTQEMWLGFGIAFLFIFGAVLLIMAIRSTFGLFVGRMALKEDTKFHAEIEITSADGSSATFYLEVEAKGGQPLLGALDYMGTKAKQVALKAVVDHQMIAEWRKGD